MKCIRGFYKGGYRKMKTLEKRLNVPTNMKTDWQKLCEECSLAAKKNNWTKEKSRDLLKKVRKELKEIETY